KWKGMSEFEVSCASSLMDAKLKLLQMINELVFLDDEDESDCPEDDYTHIVVTNNANDDNSNVKSPSHKPASPLTQTLSTNAMLRVRNQLAFLVLIRVYTNTASSWTRMEILTRILTIMYQATNVQFLVDWHAIEPLLWRMPTVSHEERKKVLSILQYVIQSTPTDTPPLAELRVIQQLLLQAIDRDM
ncbi:hypothetical protein RFI_19448, partial [Reticulomyxa filosa]